MTKLEKCMSLVPTAMKIFKLSDKKSRSDKSKLEKKNAELSEVREFRKKLDDKEKGNQK